MKLKELKEMLNELPEEMNGCEVILQKDGEGNGYSPLAGVDSESVYVPDSIWGGEAYHKESTADDNLMEKDYWEELKNNPENRAIILWPVD
jgi:hypothetical protein